MPWLFQLLIGFAFNLLGYLIAPKPPMDKPGETQDMEAPVAEAGMPVPVVFGTQRIKGLNTLAVADLSRNEYTT